MENDRELDRFSLEVFCQHCGEYLAALVSVERKYLDAARKHLSVEARANRVGRAVEVTYRVKFQRRAFIEPRPAA